MGRFPEYVPREAPVIKGNDLVRMIALTGLITRRAEARLAGRVA